MDIEEETKELCDRIMDLIDEESTHEAVSLSAICSIFILLCMEASVSPYRFEDMQQESVEYYQENWDRFQKIIREKKKSQKARK